jgi:hypothetical protein
VVRKTLLAAAVVLTALLLWRAATASSADAPSVKEIMGQANKPTGIYFNLGRDLKDCAPSWADIRPETADLAKLAAALRQATPPRGDKDSWDKLTKAYADNAAKLDKAAMNMDLDAARAAYAKMGEPACMTCHKAHKRAE